MRITEHPILSCSHGEKLTFTYEGKEVSGRKGETIAAALHEEGIRELRRSGEKNRPRGLFCSIGKCSSCLMKVDGVPNVRTCITQVRDGMEVEKQKGFPELPSEGNNLEADPIDVKRTDTLVIGGGPAGLNAALTARRAGAEVVIVDENPLLGGQLIKQTHKFFGSSREEAGKRGIDIGERLVNSVKSREGIETLTSTSAVGIYDESVGVYRNREQFLKIKPKKTIVTTGATEDTIRFRNNDLPGVYGAGGVQTLMNVYGVKPGEEVVMVGAGNVGLIVAYQLLQADVNVKAVVEIAPDIGGYFVHAAKLRRLGVPLFTHHRVLKAVGEGNLKKVVIAEVGKEGEVIVGTEKTFDVDVLALGVGLSPSYRLLDHAGCELRRESRLGGYVPVRNSRMKTTRGDIYAAGDVTGIEEATSAALEGTIAGADAVLELGFGGIRERSTIEEARSELKELRSGPYYTDLRNGLREVRK
ncbi:MAG: FAD-dependent oxidoreductase [Candidatus Acetothermia bacterium]